MNSSEMSTAAKKLRESITSKMSNIDIEKCEAYFKTAKEKVVENKWVLIPCFLLGVLAFVRGKDKKPSSEEAGLDSAVCEEERLQSLQSVTQRESETKDSAPRRKKKNRRSFMDQYYSQEQRQARVNKSCRDSKQPESAKTCISEDGSDFNDDYSTVLSEREIRVKKPCKAPPKFVISESGYNTDSDSNIYEPEHQHNLHLSQRGTFHSPRSRSQELSDDKPIRPLVTHKPSATKDDLFFKILHKVAAANK